MRNLLFLFLSILALTSFAQDNPAKIDHDLWQQIIAAPQAHHPVLIMLAEQVNSERLLEDMEASDLDMHARGRDVVLRLTTMAAATQPAFMRKLDQIPGILRDRTVSIWAINAIIVRANLEALENIAALPETGMIYGEAPLIIHPPQDIQYAVSTPNGTEPGLRAIKAPFMWNLGYTGYGLKAMIIDSGEDPEHPALRDRYWGHIAPKTQAWNATGQPEDCADHGTHVTGTILGLDRKTNDTIGVAFNAQWIGAPVAFSVGANGCTRPFQQTTFTDIQHLQWALNPDGNPNTTTDRPDVINCSFGTSTNLCFSPYVALFNNLEAAGIPVVWAAGNDGPSSSTVDGQASISISEVNSFSVGAVDAGNLSYPIASFSSRGPSICSGSGSLLIKPEVVAPGVNIRSAASNGAYQSYSGTSMAAPHVAGALLLLREAFPIASGILLKQALYNTAIDLGAAGEDNIYGRGLIDLSAAYQFLLNQGQTPAPPVSASRDAMVLNLTLDGPCSGPVTPVLEVENAGTTPITALTIKYGLETGVQNTFNWSGSLQPNAFASITLPALDGVPFGESEFFAEITHSNGDPETRILNNRFKRRYTRFNEQYAPASASALQPMPVCLNSRVLLTYNAPTPSNFQVEWFNSPTSLNRLATGSTYLTSPVTSNTTYYASTAQVERVGIQSTSATNKGTGAFLTFTAFRPFILRSVKVYAPDAGGRFIRLVDKNNNVIAQRTVILQPGEQRIELNFQVPEQSGMKLELTSAGKQLIFTSVGVSYPYTVPGIVSITGPSPFYNYFFDWEIAAPLRCGRTAIPVTVNNGASATTVAISAPDTVYLGTSGLVQLTDATPGAINQFWDFGNGDTGSGISPTTTYIGAGDYLVSLINQNAQGCSNAGTKSIHASLSVSTTLPVRSDEQVVVFPNPTGNTLYVSIQGSPIPDAYLQVFDLTGRQVQAQGSIQVQPGLLEVPVSLLPSGLYIVQLRQDGHLIWSGKFVKK
jgi:subtilisin family serine protease